MLNSLQMYGWYRYTRWYQIVVVTLALVSAIFLAFLSQPTSAVTTVPTKMNFQGRLTDSTGNIKPNGTYNMKFKIYTVASAGSPVWSEDRLVSATQGVTITNGLFSVQLGEITSLPASLFASGALYLEVELPTPATATTASPTWSEGPMSPRNQLATSAYAYNAETLDGIDSASFAQLGSNNSFTGNNTFTGTIQGNSSLTLGTAAAQGSLIVNDGNGQTATIRVADTAGNYVYTLPVTTANDTFCLQTLANCGGAGGGDVYLANANTFTNTNTIAKTSATAFRIQTDAGAATLFTANTSAMTIAMNGDTTLAAGKSLTVTGGITSTRPASPTEGMVYYDTSTKQLLTYANGKWQADQSEAILVAAANSSQADKDSADYIADGDNVAGAGTIDGDQVQINNALTAASGKKVVLLAGTYLADATILVPNNTTLAGVGQGTVIELADIDVADNLIENSDTTTGAGMVVRDLKLDGRKDLNTVGSQTAIKLFGVGSATRPGATVTNVTATRFSSMAMSLYGSYGYIVGNAVTQSSSGIIANGDSNKVSNNNLSNNTSSGMTVSGVSNSVLNNYAENNTGNGLSIEGVKNTVTGNISKNNSLGGITFYMADGSTISGNVSSDNGGYGFSSVDDSTFTNISMTGNVATANSLAGIYVWYIDKSIIQNNIVSDNLDEGIHIDTGYSGSVSSNTITNNGGSAFNKALAVYTSNNITFSDNYISDTSATTLNQAIIIGDSFSTGNRLSNNSITSGYIADSGTRTIFNNQEDGGNLVNSVSGGLVSRLQPSYSNDLFIGQNSSGGKVFGVSSSGGIQGTSLDTVTMSALTLGSTNATAINLNQSTTVLAGKTLTVGTVSNGVILADTGLTLAGTARGTRTVTLGAEYPGATFIGDGTSNNGSLGSDFCSSSSILNINAAVCPGATDEWNYYAWTTTQATAQDYDIYVRYQMPSDYDTGSMTNLKLTAMGTTGAGEIASMSLFKGSATACGTITDAITSNATWATSTLASPLGACTINAGDMVTLRIKLTAGTNNFARSGPISFTYRSKF